VSFDEHLSPKVKVHSVGPRVGILTGKLDAMVDTFFYVFLPQHTEGRLCVSFASADGTYGAQAELPRPPGKGGVHAFLFPTSHREELRQNRALDLAILAEIRPACDGGSTGQFLLARWDTPKLGDTAYVLLNPGTTAAWITRSAPDLKPIACRPSGSTNAVAFNLVCPIPLDVVRKGGDLTIERGTGAFADVPLPLPIGFP
jgi:hypothetical protein